MTIESAIDRLHDLLGDRLSTRTSDLQEHGQNEAYFPVTPPDAVAYPNDTNEVSQIVKTCATHGCPIIAWGAGTSLEGHALAVRGGIALDMRHMNRILELHPRDLDVVVQPGVTRKQLETEIRHSGLFFPVDPGADASLGGMAACRASGTTAVRYGTMRENVLALQVVLADGRIIRTGTRARKSSSGYDLTKLFVGSEGTLGIITEVTLRLQGIPEAISAATCCFDTIENAVNVVISTIQLGIPMARIELVDSVMVRGFNLLESVGLPEKPHLFVEFHGSPIAVKEQTETFGDIVSEHGGGEFKWAVKAEDRNALWKMRHNAYYAQKALRTGCQVQNTDICVPISNLAEAVSSARQEADQLGLTVTVVGHVGDGNFHCGICLDPEDEDEKNRASQFVAGLNHLALRLDGTITGEHGVGMGKIDYMQAEHGDGWQVMADIKRKFDPLNILNPGKVVRLN